MATVPASWRRRVREPKPHVSSRRSHTRDKREISVLSPRQIRTRLVEHPHVADAGGAVLKS
jgi:hypothetical protein